MGKPCVSRAGCQSRRFFGIPLQSGPPFGMRTGPGAARALRARGLAQLVRATVSKTVGREFESLSPCHFQKPRESGVFHSRPGPALAGLFYGPLMMGADIRVVTAGAS